MKEGENGKGTSRGGKNDRVQWGKYAHNEYRARHYRKIAMATNMAYHDSNFRVLRYVQLALERIGITSHQIQISGEKVRWNSESSNVITWMLQVCTGLKEGQTTSNDKLDMQWLKKCPRHLIVVFLQGLADSDGSLDPYGYYACIASVPNSVFYQKLFEGIQTKAHVYPKARPQQVRILLQDAVRLQLFNPIIRSYRYELMMNHAIRRNINPPPSSSFFFNS